MLRPNNSHIDVAVLMQKCAHIAEHRRHAQPLFGAATAHVALPAPKPGLRNRLKHTPYLGPVLRAALWLYRRIAIVGLKFAIRVRRLPAARSLVAWVRAHASIHTDRQRVQSELAQLRQFEHAAKNVLEQINARTGQLEILERQFRQQFDSLDIATRLALFDSLDIATRLALFDSLDIATRLAQLDALSQTSASQAQQQNNRIATLTREINQLTGTNTGTPATPRQPAPAAPPLSPVNDRYNNFYLEFEDNFRGTRSDITQRLRVYLPYLARFTGTPAVPMVDVGCGRGEWLALLQQHGFQATGVDLNAQMVQSCTELGLQARCADAVTYLRAQARGSLGLVTGFHIIEHLPFETLLALIDAALHALRPDGLVIFETPNPENLLVGACNFYHDPTHRHPIVPAVAQFMAQQRGFAKTDIVRLHPYPQAHWLAEDSEVAKRINQAFYGPQDYALIAWKEHAT